MASFLAVCDPEITWTDTWEVTILQEYYEPKTMYSSEKKSLKMTFATFASSLIPRENGWHSILPGLSALGFKKNRHFTGFSEENRPLAQ